MSDLGFEYRVIEAHQYPEEIFPNAKERRLYASISRALIGAEGFVRDPASHESHLKTAIQAVPPVESCTSVLITVASFDPALGKRGTMPNPDHFRGLTLAADTYLRGTHMDVPSRVMTFGNSHRRGFMLDELSLAAIGKNILLQYNIPAEDIVMSTELRKNCYNTADELAIAVAELKKMDTQNLWIHITREDRVARTLLHASAIGMVPHKIIAFEPEGVVNTSFIDQITQRYSALLDPSMQHPMSPLGNFSRLVKGAGIPRKHKEETDGL